MKKLLFLTATCAILTAPAMAVQKCVALDVKNSRCYQISGEYGDFLGKADWSATCTTNGTSVPIKGIAMCSNQAADARFSTSDAITTVYNESEDTTNVNCWCKMVEPAVSSWVFVDTFPSAGICEYNCSYECTYTAPSYSEFLSAMFGSLAN